ncbi:hypothetical protein HF668_12685 [Acidithiobacillus ferridurans]|jgi:thermostable 8-oxoguanine DNA glycosylase|uniref:hypothetical protein n=1 Tax=Acidithiobacillus ferridurans TaxID=1232575 RepID=UPI001C06D0AA|nr:hypothetical protein [Acidithiobacillus ferridurans]MBU2805984.1 hypothetical protein [Acidithiobacillus ferridurans]
MKKTEQWIKRELEREETFCELTARIKAEMETRMRKDLEELKKGWEKIRSKNRGG